MPPRPHRRDGLFLLFLRLYPRAFRERFGGEMLELFSVRHADAARRGSGARLRFWWRVCRDLLASVWREWRRELPDLPAPTALRDDVHHAWRAIRRAPALSAAIVGLVALTVGATTTMFSVTDGVLLRPLPYPDPDQLVAIWEQRLDRGLDRNTVGAHEFPVWAERARSFDALAAYTYSGSTVHVSGDGDPAELFAARVTGGFFDVMRVTPLVGRPLTPADDVPGADAVVVLSERTWRDRFGADAGVLGRRISLNDRPHEIVGVMPGVLRFPERGAGNPPDAWVPIAEPIHLYRGRHYLFVIGRLASGVTLEQANGEFASVTAALAEELPEFNKGHAARAWSLADDRTSPARPWLLLLLSASACLTLIGCANVAGLLVARAERRRHESHVRLALGASGARLARQSLVESLTLAVSGGLVGTALAASATRAIPALVPAEVWALDHVPFDGRVLAFSFGLSVITGLTFGVAPVWTAVRGSRARLTIRSRATIGGRHGRLRHALVAGQIALALVLTSSAGLLARSLGELRAVDPSFRTESILSVDLSLPGSRYPDATRVRAFFDEVTERVSRLPGVERAATVNHVPLGGSFDAIGVTIEGRPAAPPGAQPSVRYRVVSTEYFRTLDIPVMMGRDFARSDARRAVPLIRWFPEQPAPEFADAPQPEPVAVVSEAMERAFWPDGAMGKRFRLLHSPWITVVGVVAGTRGDSLLADPRPECYLLDLQEPVATMSLLVAAGSAELMVSPIRRVVQEIDPALPLGRVTTLEGLVAATRQTPRFTSLLVGSFAATALLLMMTGVYGLMAFLAAARTREIGLRVALGATRSSIHRLVYRRALAMVASGGAAGLAGSLAVSPLVGTMLFHVEPTDPLTLATVIAAVAAVSLVAAAAPARRAARVDPVRALHHD